MSAFFQVFASYRMFICLLLGFSAGIPLGLTGGTLQAWMASEKVDLTMIGIFSLVGLPYTLKFVWAPLMDRYMPPFLGRRRGWMLVSQIALIALIIVMGFSNPVAAPGMLALLAFGVAFSSASQDIVIDAYRTEVLNPNEYGAGAGVYILGYRLAMLTSGAVALIMSDHLPWSTVYAAMAACMGVGVLATIFGPEPKVREAAPKSLATAVVGPFMEYFRRRGALEMLAFIILYKLGDVLAGAMTTPFMIELGFTKTDIGAINKMMGVWTTIGGALLGGIVINRIGIQKSLWIFGGLQAVSNLGFMVLAQAGHHYPTLVGAIFLENLAGGMGTAAFSAFLMSLCNRKFTATQYALLTSLMAVTRVIVGSGSGWMAKNIGWELYFLATAVLAIPGLLFLFRFKAWTQDELDAPGTAATQPV